MHVRVGFWALASSKQRAIATRGLRWRVLPMTIKVDPVNGGSKYLVDEWVGLENTGLETIRVVFIFAALGYDTYLRATSVPEGHEVEPFSPSELAEVRRKYRAYITFKGKFFGRRFLTRGSTRNGRAGFTIEDGRMRLEMPCAYA